MAKWKTFKKGLDQKFLRETTTKYHPHYSKHRHELDNKSRKQCNISFIDKKIANKVIMDCRTISAHKFRKRLEFKQHDVILTKEPS